MDKMEEIATPRERRCPSCGAAMPAEARFCGACGAETAPAPASDADAPAASEPVTAAPVTAAPVASAPAPKAPASVVAQSGDGRLCLWCGARSPLEAATCVACGAVFPTPEGDAALERAAQERIRAMESDLKPPRAGWWPFRAR